MATIIKKIKKGRPYYYAVESKRVNGKPRIVWQKYLGTVDAIINRTEEAKPPAPKEAVLFEAGGVAALLGIADKLGVLDIINEEAPKRKQGPSVGHYMLLAAINRALSPSSKEAIGDWYEKSVLSRLWRISKRYFSSQRFWDHMDMMGDAEIEKIQDRLLMKAKEEFGLSDSMLLYDTTNFFTFLATGNDRAEIPKRGRNKAKRHDLRQIGMALLVSRDFQIPLLHHVYSGNVTDVSLFPSVYKELIARYSKLVKTESQFTLVFDKGNVSDDGMEQLVVNQAHFVAALSANRRTDILETALERFESLPELAGCKAYSTKDEIWGKECRFVLSYTESFFSQQLSGVSANLVKCQKKLFERAKMLEKWRKGKGRGKKPTASGIKKSVRAILSPQFMKDLMVTELFEQNGLPVLKYSLDHGAFNRLIEKRLGRTLLVTDQIDWTPLQIIEAYRSLSRIEETFKNMKNVQFLRWQPAFHWTDQKLKVHGFYCVLALLLASLARKVVMENGIDLTLPALLKELTAIREVAVIHPQGTPARRRDHITLSRMSPRQRRLAELLRIGEVLAGG